MKRTYYVEYTDGFMDFPARMVGFSNVSEVEAHIKELSTAYRIIKIIEQSEELHYAENE